MISGREGAQLFSTSARASGPLAQVSFRQVGPWPLHVSLLPLLTLTVKPLTFWCQNCTFWVWIQTLLWLAVLDTSFISFYFVINMCDHLFGAINAVIGRVNEWTCKNIESNIFPIVRRFPGLVLAMLLGFSPGPHWGLVLEILNLINLLASAVRHCARWLRSIC